MRWKRQLRRSYWFNYIQNLTKCRLIIYQSIPTREEFICSRFQWWLFSAGLHLCMFGNRCHNITHLMHISAHLINPSLSQKRSKLYSSDLIRQFRFVICKNICWFGQKLSDLLFFEDTMFLSALKPMPKKLCLLYQKKLMFTYTTKN